MERHRVWGIAANGRLTCESLEKENGGPGYINFAEDHEGVQAWSYNYYSNHWTRDTMYYQFENSVVFTVCLKDEHGNYAREVVEAYR